LVVLVFISLIIVAVGILSFDFLASRFGSHTRDGSDWNNHSDGIEQAAAQRLVNI